MAMSPEEWLDTVGNLTDDEEKVVDCVVSLIDKELRSNVDGNMPHESPKGFAICVKEIKGVTCRVLWGVENCYWDKGWQDVRIVYATIGSNIISVSLSLPMD